MNLHDRWHELWRQLALTPHAEAIAQLLAHYSEPGRYYHSITHLEECFAHLDDARQLAAHPAEVELALWYHDAIYDTRAKDSEDRSAAWAALLLGQSGAPPVVIARVNELILATKHDAKPAGSDAALLVDIDLAILGAPEARFDQYETQVRQEYGWVSERDFRQGRGNILRQFLRRQSIYSTAWFHQRLESRARANLARSLASLGFAAEV